MPKRIRPRQDLVTNNGQLTAHLVAEDIGWAAFPAAAQPAIDEGRLAHALPQWSIPGIEVYALYSREQHPLSNARVCFSS